MNKFPLALNWYCLIVFSSLILVVACSKVVPSDSGSTIEQLKSNYFSRSVPVLIEMDDDERNKRFKIQGIYHATSINEGQILYKQASRAFGRIFQVLDNKDRAQARLIIKLNGKLRVPMGKVEASTHATLLDKTGVSLGGFTGMGILSTWWINDTETLVENAYEEALNQVVNRIIDSSVLFLLGESHYLTPQVKTAETLPRLNTQKPASAGLVGTGIVINQDGYILTTSSVVEGCENLRAEIGGISSNLKKVLLSNSTQLAIVKANGQFANVARFRLGKGISLNAPIIGMGFKTVNIKSTIPAWVHGRLTSRTAFDGDFSYMTMTIAGHFENSSIGWALMDEAGFVSGLFTGMLTSSQDNTTAMPQTIIAVDGLIIRALLEAQAIDYELGHAEKLSSSSKGFEKKTFIVPLFCD